MAPDPLTPRLATIEDAPLVGRIGGMGFYDDPVLSWAVAAPETRLERLTFAFTGSAVRTISEPHGEAWIVDDSCVALWRPPEYDHHPADTPVGGEEEVGEEFESPLDAGDQERFGLLGDTLRANHPHEPHWYLNIIATAPDRRGRGLGAAVLEPVLARCDADGARAYLESTNPRNRTLYRRVGFVDGDEIQIPGGPSLLSMWREPRG